MTQNLRSIVVTGASRGIGKAIAQALANDNSFVWVNYRSRQEDALLVVDQIRSAGGHAQDINFDVSSSESVQAAFATIEEVSGGVDVLVNNSGVAIDSLLLRSKDADIAKTIQTNLLGAMYCSRAAMKTMLRRKNYGRIISVGSVVGLMGNAGQTAYAASKGGLFAFTKSLAREVASRQITVNAVAPGFVKTDMTVGLKAEQQEAMLKMIPLGRYAEPDEIASVIQFLASSQSSYITGQVISINGGMFM